MIVIAEGRNDPFAPEFKAAAFSLGTNQISDIVTTVFGYHIIKLQDRIAAKKLDFAKVAPEIKEALVQQAMQTRMPEYFAEVKKAGAIEILDPRYKINTQKSTVDSLRPTS